MELKKSNRKKSKIRLSLQGPSGSGKTFSALLIAVGLCGSWEKIAVIDSENHSSELYSHLGGFSVIDLKAPFTPERYIEAIKLCETSGIEVIVIDSISHEWESEGGILSVHSQMSGNSFTNWGKLTPRHNNFIQAILQSTAHIVATVRSKQDYVLNQKDGKQVPEKVGLKGVSRDGLDYEMTIALNLNIKHFAQATKDRTGLFMDKPEFVITSAIGEQILAWCHQGTAEPVVDEFTERIRSSKSYDELKKLYTDNPQLQASYMAEFTKRKKELENPPAPVINLSTSNYSSNGTSI